MELNPLRSINLIVGPNSSGKTSLLRALFMFCLDGDASKLSGVSPPDVDEPDLETIEADLRLVFYTKDQNRSSKVSVSGFVDSVRREVVLSEIPASGYGLERLARTTRVTSDREADLLRSQVVLDIEQVRRDARSIFHIVTRHGESENDGILYISDLHGLKVELRRPASPRLPALLRRSLWQPDDGLAAEYDKVSDHDKVSVLEMVRGIDPLVRSIEIGVASDGRPVLRASHKDLGKVPLTQLGDAVSAVCHHAVLACRDDIAVVILDEFDASLHVEVLRNIARFYQKQAAAGRQIFLTTHRYDTVDAFVDLVDEEWSDLALIQMSKKADGSAGARVLVDDMLVNTWQKLGIDLRVPS